MMSALLIASGLVLLVLGGEGVVRGSVALARRLGVSELMIGLTLVGFGTSTPELLTSVQAALLGAPGLSVGNVIGSNIANVLLILGVTALLATIPCDPRAVRRDGAVVVIATLACLAAVLIGSIGRLPGALLVAGLVLYIVVTYRLERKGGSASAELHAGEAELAGDAPQSLWVSLAFAVGGIALTMVGAKLLVDGAIDLARLAGVSDAVIGLTVVAVGTSLPELVASITAALKKRTDLALGNILGSNIYNVLGILGLTAMIQPLDVPPSVAAFDIWIMLASAVALVVFATTGGRISRPEGAIFMVGYGAYLALLARNA
ncbi:MAG: calcium/sodium antiporter [Rhodospirillales bacterium]